MQHGFREKRSCEMQLIMLIDELAKNMQMGKQTDLILLDFSKAFDKVAHEKLLLKLHHYGIRGDTLKWIKDFLDNRKQAVVINRINGPILFLAYINDRNRLFADDTALYLAISPTTESEVLQTDLASLEQWEKMWDMQFNPSKCQVLQITKKAKPLNTKYILHNVELESVPAAKYLGVTIADDLSWSKLIDFTTKRANQTLGFLKRNIRVHNKDLKSVAYKTLVRPQLEYASTVWYPHTTTDINNVEAVRRRAARWATRDNRYTSSVTAMLKDLNWRPLDQRRIDSRLVMMYKVTYDVVAIPASDYLVRNTRTSRHIHP